MKAITLWQPWATLLACGAKQYETRSWETKYRGPIAIHAAVRPVKLGVYEAFDDTDSLHVLCSAIRDAGIIPANTPLAAVNGFFIKGDAFPHGAVIATAELVACYRVRDDISLGVPRLEDPLGNPSRPIGGNELLLGDFTPRRYAWEFQNMKILDTPIPAKGGRRLWNWEE